MVMEKGLVKNIKLAMETSSKRTVFIQTALIIILGFIIYANSLPGQFIWDDVFLIKDNVYIKNWQNLPKLFLKDTGTIAGQNFNYYRPLQLLTHMADYSLWRFNVSGYHLINILLHILAGLSVYYFIYTLYGDNLLAWLTGLFFLVHPVHTEAVAYISGRNESLALIFMLLCFTFYVRYLYLKNARSYIFTILSYILALLSKESTLILPLLLILYHYVLGRKIDGIIFLPLIMISLLYFLWREAVLGSSLISSALSTGLFNRIPGFFAAFINYIRILFLPFRLHFDYGDIFFKFSNPKVISGILLFLSLFIYALKVKSSNNLVSFSIMWFFIALIPFSGLCPLPFYMAEHWLYVASIGFFLIAAKILCSLYRNKKFKVFTLIFIPGLLSFYSCLTIRQNRYWREPITFYKKTLEYSPLDPRIYNNLGYAYYEAGDKEKSIEVFKKVLQIAPGYVQVYYNLGSIYAERGDNRQAMDYFKKAIEIAPETVYAYNNLANLYYNEGKKEEAVDLYKKAIEINPDYAIAYNNLARIYYYEGNYELAGQYFKKAAELGYKAEDRFLNKSDK